ncbi:MAG TPA: M28 family peptidase, partial [Methylomirabilota bacterium]|nr:M28 family peptidase [Methylomirabilota bacterium]
SEQAILAALDVENVRANIEHICENIPSRLAGSENGRRMAEYSAAALQSVDVAATVHTLPGLVSFPERAEFKVIAPVEITIHANTLGHSVPTPADGITGELLDVYSGAFTDYEGKDARGAITLSELSYHPARHEKQRVAGLLGAAGCVMMNWGADDNAAVPFGSVKPAWGNPTPDTVGSEMPVLPCIGIARTDGLKLRGLAKKGPVRVWFRAHVENGWRPIQITTGEVRAEHDEDFVLLGGHQDSWFGPAATDNAAGNSCVIELARVFNAHRDQLRRGLVLGFWAGHETGTMIGSSWFVDRHWDRLREHMVAYMQIDQPSCTGTTWWETRSNAELRRFHQGVEQRLIPQRTRHWRHATKIGDASFFGLGVPMMAGQGAFTESELKATALANLGWWHHSLECTIDKVNFEYLKEHLRVYGGWLWELLTARVLPFTYEPVADRFIARLTELAPAGKTIGLDGALSRAEQFKAAAIRLDAVADGWRKRYEADGVKDDEPALRLNRCMKRLGRLLIPLESTAIGTYGHDPYGLTSQTTMIPCLYDAPRMAALAEGEERWMLETKLVRQRNRVADALGDARALVDETLRGL